MEIDEVIQTFFIAFLEKLGWDTYYRINFYPKKHSGHLLNASIDTKDWIIKIEHDTRVLKEFQNLDKRRNVFRKLEKPLLINSSPGIKKTIRKHKDVSFYKEFFDFVSGIAYHEMGHSTECPIDEDHYSEIIQAISSAMEIKKREGQKTLAYIANLFMDIIVNVSIGFEEENSFFRNSLFIHHVYELENIVMDGKDHSFHYFVLVNLYLFQFHEKIRDEITYLLLERIPRNYRNKLKQLLAVFCTKPEIVEKVMMGLEPSEEERWKIRNYISESTKWGKLAYDFALKILDVTAEDHKLPKDLPVETIYSKGFLEDPSFKSRIIEKIVNRKTKKRVRKKPKKGEVENDGNATKNQESYPGEWDIQVGTKFIPGELLYDKIYKNRAKKLVINNLAKQKSKNLEYGWLNKNLLQNPQNFQNLDLFGTYFIQKNEGEDHLLLTEHRHPLTLPQESSRSGKKYPNFVFLCDDSGSMDWKPLRGTGKYDSVLIMMYSLFNWLNKQDFAPAIKYNFSSFSNTTRSTGWLNYFHIEDYSEILFHPERQGTNLNIRKFREILSHPEEKVVLILTDGEISNRNKVLSLVTKNVRPKNFLFLQIGRFTSKLAESLETAGYGVILIKNKKLRNLSTVVLNFLRGKYNTMQ